ncbi:hypothetical protein Zmor_007820 [Zophobas morio]|uniref:Secreted protein n=1 Tax=Zophobas morio TaxID=2755281 RepID=A0AA38IYB8_9CUCU|nr:hypothetical protein Zmor_007820 [Zophobas morio]
MWTLKLSTLLALTTAYKIQALILNRVSCLRFIASKVWATVVDPTETSLRDGIYPNFEFNIFTEEAQLCVFIPLRLYLEATQSLRGKEDYLLIIFRKLWSLTQLFLTPFSTFS